MRETISKARSNCAKCVEPIDKGDRVVMVTMQNYSFARVHAECYERMRAIAMAVIKKRVSLSPLVMDIYRKLAIHYRHDGNISGLLP